MCIWRTPVSHDTSQNYFQKVYFFVTNNNNNHWIINCVCNPWMYLLRKWKTSNANNLSKKILSIMDDRFVHGFITFNPIHDFISKTSIQLDYSQHRDALIWFLNLSYMYHCAKYKNMINKIDFWMFHYLRSSNKKNYWKDTKPILIIGKILMMKTKGNNTRTYPNGLLI